ncbi:MAG: winged helix-turn-helix domain-containing protein [Thermoanaerobaculia bacterium]|nr:winged helix-turn-helix domain-containing protein [Thermoanaerobaculia bacterium]
MRIHFAGCTFDSARLELTRGGVRAALTPKAFALLETLVAARPDAVSKEALYERLWPATFVEPGNLHNLIADIRAAIGDDDHTIIRTVHRVGYAFDAAIRDEAQAATFIVVIGNREFVLRPGENFIGRDPDCRVVLNTPDVSRRHARITVGATTTIEDLGSKNGTFVGQKRITQAEAIGEGAAIVVGRTHLTLRAQQVLEPTITAS